MATVVEADMTIFSPMIVKDCVKSGFNIMCRQVEILNGNNDECMVLSHFHDGGLKELRLRRQKDYNKVTRTNDSIFMLQGSAVYDEIIRKKRQINISDTSRLVHSLTNTFYDKETESIVTIFKSENRRGIDWNRRVHSNVGIYKYSKRNKKASIVSFIGGSMETDSDCAFYVLLGNNNKTIYGVTIQTKGYGVMIFKLYKLLLSSGWVQELESIEISHYYYLYNERNMVIIDNKLYLFCVGELSYYVRKKRHGLCEENATHIGILDFKLGKYEIKKKMMQGEILYVAIPFGLGSRYVALFPDIFMNADNVSLVDAFYEHPAMMLFDCSKKTIFKLKQQIPRRFYRFISYYSEDSDGFIAKDVGELIVDGWIRRRFTLGKLRSMYNINWPSYMNKVVFKYYYLEAKIGICGLYAIRGDDDRHVYVSIPFDYLSCF